MWESPWVSAEACYRQMQGPCGGSRHCLPRGEPGSQCDRDMVRKVRKWLKIKALRFTEWDGSLRRVWSRGGMWSDLIPQDSSGCSGENRLQGTRWLGEGFEGRWWDMHRRKTCENSFLEPRSAQGHQKLGGGNQTAVRKDQRLQQLDCRLLTSDSLLSKTCILSCFVVAALEN